MRILSIDGGGIRGLLAATVLEAYEAVTMTPVWRQFGLVAGTSTGGILGAVLAMGLPASHAVALYRERAADIFRPAGLSFVPPVFGPKYHNDGLRRALMDVLGEATLADVRTDLMVTAYDLADPGPAFFKSWRPEDSRRSLVEVCLATSAAPTFFPAVRGSGGASWYVDGGLHSNNPSVAALVEGLARAPVDEVNMLSVGAGQESFRVDGYRAQGWGAAGWAASLLTCMFDGQSDAAHYQCRRLLGDRYVRLQATSPEGLAMDSTDERSLDTLVALGHDLVESDDFVRAVAMAQRRAA